MKLRVRWQDALLSVPSKPLAASTSSRRTLGTHTHHHLCTDIIFAGGRGQSTGPFLVLLEN
eukprot:5486972-Prorocentrum_lima.AAC.1